MRCCEGHIITTLLLMMRKTADQQGQWCIHAHFTRTFFRHRSRQDTPVGDVSSSRSCWTTWPKLGSGLPRRRTTPALAVERSQHGHNQEWELIDSLSFFDCLQKFQWLSDFNTRKGTKDTSREHGRLVLKLVLLSWWR